ncbi:MAG TPA: cytochrome c [Thermoanaerobaculia bacterium]|nr:cytochrome c [Thermoanaerobaculia bacterium]
MRGCARGLRLGAFAALLVALSGCRGCPSSRPPIHLNPNMDNQPKLLAQAESGFFADGKAMRTPVEGTVARGGLAAFEPASSGRDAAGDYLAGSPVAASEGVLRRGEQRYGVFCAPCHGERGDGRGMLYQRAQVESADLLAPRIRQMPEGQLFEVIGDGFGLMPPYRAQVPVVDRWAIVAHVRALQAAAGPDLPAVGEAAATAAEGQGAAAAEEAQ